MNIPRHPVRLLSALCLAGTLGGCYYPPYPYPQYSYNYYPAYPAYSAYYYSPVSPYFYGYPTTESSNGGNGR